MRHKEWPAAALAIEKPQYCRTGGFVCLIWKYHYFSLPTGIIAYAVLKCNIHEKRIIRGFLESLSIIGFCSMAGLIAKTYKGYFMM